MVKTGSPECSFQEFVKIVNTTDWNTAALKKLFIFCLQEVRKCEGKKWNLRQLRVKICYCRGSCVGGSAYLNSDSMKMKMPRGDIEHFSFEGNDKAKEIADTFIHELGHIIGLGHDKKKNTMEHLYESFIKDKIDEQRFPIFKTMKTKVKVDLRAKRFQLAQKNLDRAQTRFKRAKTILNKWLQQVRYYEKQFAMAADKDK